MQAHTHPSTKICSSSCANARAPALPYTSTHERTHACARTHARQAARLHMRGARQTLGVTRLLIRQTCMLVASLEATSGSVIAKADRIRPARDSARSSVAMHHSRHVSVRQWHVFGRGL
eukprot:662079-Pleurochrysis_carterae.AAC.2